jgi:hypothetical protein
MITLYEIKYALRFILIGSAICLFIMGLYWGWVGLGYKEKVYCGKIYKKISSIEVHKSSATNEFIFVIDFPYGRDEVDVSASTYVSHKEGETVCFNLKDRDSLDRKYEGKGILLVFWGFICWAVVVIASIVGICKLIGWIFKD